MTKRTSALKARASDSELIFAMVLNWPSKCKNVFGRRERLGMRYLYTCSSGDGCFGGQTAGMRRDKSLALSCYQKTLINIYLSQSSKTEIPLAFHRRALQHKGILSIGVLDYNTNKRHKLDDPGLHISVYDKYLLRY